jgi:predicted porin
MKKLLIATAALAMVAGTAQAQSSVTVYGIVDVNITSQDNGSAGRATTVGENTIATSRLGFRGTEDLGGGLKAEFQLESKLTPSNGVAGSGTGDSTKGSSQLFSRESWVGLNSSSLGAVRLGTTDITNAVNIDAITSQAADMALNTNEIGTDVIKAVRYTSPTFSGVTVELGYATPTSAATAENTTGSDATDVLQKASGTMTSAFIKYEAGKLGLYAGQIEEKIAADYSRKQMGYGLKYDFGVVALGASFNVQDAATSGDVAAKGDFEQTRVTLSAPVAALGAGVKAHAVYFKDQQKGTTVQTTDQDGYKLALTKAFSKRTTGYVGYINADKELTSEVDTKTFVLGVNHSF